MPKRRETRRLGSPAESAGVCRSPQDCVGQCKVLSHGIGFVIHRRDHIRVSHSKLERLNAC